MNEIDLRRFDLNLLVVFEVLMIERNVTRAADRLGRTQSAVSHSLSRLRRQFGDPLLIKAGARMLPTAFALDLIEQARPMLRGIERVLSPRHVFDPASSRRVFRFVAPDFTLTLFANLLARLRRDHRLTVLMVSHDLAVIAHLCERIAVMAHGAVIETTTADALASGKVTHPYTRQLLRSNRGFDRSGAEIVDVVS